MLDFWLIWVYNKDTEREVLTMAIFNETNCSSGATASIARDPYNSSNSRNIKNTSKAVYNCGGYALNLFAWYCPWGLEVQESETPLARAYWQGDLFGTDEMFTPTFKCVQNMLAEIPTLRLLTGINDHIADNEYMLAFRISYDGDFHYAKRGNNGVWHHKRGSRDEIETMTILELLDESWLGRYDGPLVFFANIKKQGLTKPLLYGIITIVKKVRFSKWIINS